MAGIPDKPTLDGIEDRWSERWEAERLFLTADGEAESTVLVQSDGLVDGAYNGLVKRGTPVTATLLLLGW